MRNIDATKRSVEGARLTMSDFRVTRKPLPSPVQRAWLKRGVDQPGGKLPLFDEYGQAIDPRTIKACVDQGWAAPWFANPLKPDWLVCKLTAAGRALVARPASAAAPRTVVEIEKTSA
jgi:hypothetical protein